MAEDKLVITVKEERLSLGELLLYRMFKILERNFPTHEDKPFTKTFSKTIKPGKTATINIGVPKNAYAYMKEIEWSYSDNTRYSLSKDDGTLICDTTTRNIQPLTFDPPIVVKNKISLKIENNDSVTHTYTGYVRGWKRSK